MTSSNEQRAKLQTSKRAALGKSKDRRRIISVELIFHVLALAWYLRVWLWHFGSQAAQLPGARGFGWFTRYLTFYSFSLQLLQLVLCCTTALLPDSLQKRKAGKWADDLSCALFGLANAVTIMFYTLEATTKGMVEGGRIDRPPWLGFAVHVSNSIVAWLDLLLSKQRNFSKRSSRLSLVLVAFYTMWILVSSYFNQSFPYPFLNRLPWPQGFLGVMVAGQVLFYFLFKLGKLIRRLLQYVRKTAESAVSQRDLNVKAQ